MSGKLWKGMIMAEKYTIAELEKRIHYKFQNPALLKQAITHSSFANEQKINKYGDYERLEFLGDAVLELVSSSFLFHEYQDLPEGKLTKMRSSMVCEPALAFCARELEIGKFLLLGKGEEATGGRNRESIIADVMEAITGAIYLDGGFEHASGFIHEFILSDLDNKKLFYDAKSVLQEMVQSLGEGDMRYELIREEGPEHNKRFFVQAVLKNKIVGSGEGHNKKAAEQQAAYEAILEIRKICQNKKWE